MKMVIMKWTWTAMMILPMKKKIRKMANRKMVKTKQNQPTVKMNQNPKVNQIPIRKKPQKNNQKKTILLTVIKNHTIVPVKMKTLIQFVKPMKSTAKTKLNCWTNHAKNICM